MCIRDSAMAAQWVNDAAREQRLQRIEKVYADQVRLLGGNPAR